MFTGIIEQIGTVEKNENGTLAVAVPLSFTRGLRVGGSVAVNGACLTNVKCQMSNVKCLLYFDIVSETLHRTNFGLLMKGDEVNLEKALKVGDRLEGHIVLGHVDTIGLVTRYSLLITKAGTANRILKIALPKKHARLIVPKGSIAVDGVSFTVVEAGANYFTVAVIPHTFEHTIAKQYTKGAKVNVETDIVGKYASKTET